MQLSVFFPLLEKINNPFGWISLFVLFIVPLIIGIFRSLLIFYNEHIRHFRAKNFELALSKLSENSIEHTLLEECKVQELIYINTKLNLSMLERAIVLDWLRTKPVTIGLIRKAWPQVIFENGCLIPRLEKYEMVFMWYSLVVLGGLVVYGTFIFFKLLLDHVIEQQTYHFLLIPTFLYFLAYLMFKQSEPMFSARRLIYRLQ